MLRSLVGSEMCIRDSPPSRSAVMETLSRQSEDLLAAVTGGSLGTVESLLGEGAPAEAVDQDGNTALHIAAGDGDLRLVEALVGVCELSGVNAAGQTALHLAVCWGHHEIALRLLEAKADPNPTDKHGECPLHYAVANQDLDCVRLLRSALGDHTILNGKGVSPGHMAERLKLDQISKVLEATPPAMPLSKRRRDERAFLMDMTKGDSLRYKKTGENVILLSVHLNDVDPYCTVKMPDGTERQTTAEHLEVLRVERKAKRQKITPAASKAAAVYISGLLPDDATEKFLRSLFSPFGEILHVKLYKNQWGKSKGDALVNLSTEADARSAIKKLNGKEVRPGVPLTASSAEFNLSLIHI
eukprot:TRINITY_DN36102_c0_g1_i4.p1 TRINITY_DN36102_c0_g1~~TRINITY_DN36102_c0_g1_i4.p1  ORF type:complete len:357 (-),score=83.75 TRINITY_DN36102_c0_g1_i4:175-1245(-)